jgi:transposase InsO family protein
MVKRVEMHGWSVEEAAEAAGISDRRGYHWLARWRERGADGLRDGSSRPKTTTRTALDREAVVIALRHTRMTSPLIARRLKMPAATVKRILSRAGLNRLRALDPKPPVVRYERSRAGELIHLDVKKLGRIGRPGHRVNGDRTTRARGVGWEFVHVCIDDATRLAYVEVLSDERGATAAAFLRRAAAWYRRRGIVVERVMSDNGSCYVSLDFRRACAELSARHIRTRPYRPETNGKAERFIQTLLREWAYSLPFANSDSRTQALPRWLCFYNRHRPHSALNGQSPYERLRTGPLNNLVSFHT